MDSKNHFYCIVEGNIGAGKSTFLKLISNYLNLNIVYEPLNKWQNIEGQNLLEYFYNDPKRWAYTFQTYAFVSRTVQIEETFANTSGIILAERSIYSDRYCFAYNAYLTGLMSLLEWDLYKQWFAWLESKHTCRPNAFIYLRTDPKVSYERLKKRKREEEVGVTLDYLISINQMHERWLVRKENIPAYLADIPVLILDCDRDFENNNEVAQCYIQKVKMFFEQFGFLSLNRDSKIISCCK